LEELKSKALVENLAVTRAAKVEVPNPMRWLEGLGADYHGIRQRCVAMLEEVYHPFANPEEAMNLFRQSILSDLWIYIRTPEKPKAIGLIHDLLERIRGICQTDAQKKRWLAEYLDLIAALNKQEGIDPGIFSTALENLRMLYTPEPALFIQSSGVCRKAMIGIAKGRDKAFCADAFQFVRELLVQGLQQWRGCAGIDAWADKRGDSLSIDGQHLRSSIGSGFYAHWLAEADNAIALAGLVDIPAYNDIASAHRSMIPEFPSQEERIHYIFHLLYLPGMQDLSDHLLWDLNRQLTDIGTSMNVRKLYMLLDSILDALKDLYHTHTGVVLDCLLTVGKAVLATKDTELIQHCMDSIIDLGFVPPGKVTIDRDWQISANKDHIKNIRVWLELVGIDPSRNRNLLSALTINLVSKGVFISDTDLFQKDVSRFLNSDMASLFVQMKHLLRLFPVYFTEIGAEGEIRDVSTSVDELSGRSDRLIHFLRKQVHTESNNTHIALSRNILWYWYDLSPAHLEGSIPEDVAFQISFPDEQTIRQHKYVQAFLDGLGLDPNKLLALSWQRASAILDKAPEPENFAAKRTRLLCRIFYLLQDKYQLDPFDIVKFLRRCSFFDAGNQSRLEQNLTRRNYDGSIRQLLEYIGILNSRILDPNPTQGWENIYYKRHIAAGIPSMYGQYHEPKLEALGLIFRLENVVRRLLESNIAQLNLSYITGRTLNRIIRILELFFLGLRSEGIRNEAFGTALDMLKSCQRITNLTLDQYLDIFTTLKDSINEIINEYFYRFYDRELKLARGPVQDGNQSGTDPYRFAEEFYRKLLSSSFLVQELDSFVAKVLSSLGTMQGIFTAEEVGRVMNYDPDLLFVHLETRNARVENQVLLGSKGFFLKRLHRYEFPVPPGFVITTEMYRNKGIIFGHPDIELEWNELLKQNLEKLERATGQRFGDPEVPLLLSVRSGAPMSLPGAMSTYLNVGMNDAITESLCKVPNYGWTAWDCYRRLIQSWGMAYGIPRDAFDAVMVDYKSKYGVQLKTQFSPAQMRAMCQDYKQVLAARGIELEQDPFLQIKLAIGHVLDSWNTDLAVLYRQKMHIADEWGTAVLVQKMVLGNISLESGSGVLFTHSEQSSKPGIHLNGDFTLCSQGEDVVAGLVHTLPISEEQRLLARPPAASSLQKDYPQIYNRLDMFVHQLVADRGYPHQEIEFTFEGPREDQLFILQTRNQIIAKAREFTVISAPRNELKLAGHGIGIGKGVLNGLIAFSREDIEELRPKGLPIILVRPDTVPDDMDLLFDCQGLLTARGGVTSHAAVTATRLGIIGIVNCRDLKVFETKSHCRIGKTNLRNGDAIAIDAGSGNIYLGHYPTEVFRA